MTLDDATINRLSELVAKNKEIISETATRLSNVPIYDYNKDIQYILQFLHGLTQGKQLELTSKYLFLPKGKVLIGISSNDPIINSIIPIISALRAGNKVVVRPSSKTLPLTQLLTKLLLASGVQYSKLVLKPPNKKHVVKLIRQVDFVYWAGSSKVCEQIALECAKANKKFYLESEGNDAAIIDYPIQNIKEITNLIARDLSSHNGERCQTPREIYVHKKLYKKFVGLLKNEIYAIPTGSLVDKRTRINPTYKRQLLESFNSMSKKKPVIIKMFKTYPQLRARLCKNEFGLSLTVFSSKKFSSISELILKGSSFSRVNINKPAGFVSPYQPWGGLKKSGMFGPQPWINKFTDRVFINK